MTGEAKWLSRWSSKSKFVHDKCYSRLDQPLQARTFRIHEEHDVHPDPKWGWFHPLYEDHELQEEKRWMHTRNLLIQHELKDGNLSLIHI